MSDEEETPPTETTPTEDPSTPVAIECGLCGHDEVYELHKDPQICWCGWCGSILEEDEWKCAGWMEDMPEVMGHPGDGEETT